MVAVLARERHLEAFLVPSQRVRGCLIPFRVGILSAGNPLFRVCAAGAGAVRLVVNIRLRERGIPGRCL